MTSTKKKKEKKTPPPPAFFAYMQFPLKGDEEVFCVTAVPVKWENDEKVALDGHVPQTFEKILPRAFIARSEADAVRRFIASKESDRDRLLAKAKRADVLLAKAREYAILHKIP